MENLITGKTYKIKDRFHKVKLRHLDPGVNDDMMRYAGQNVTIVGPTSTCNHWYKVKENDWTWDISWLEEIEPELDIGEITDTDLMSMFGE